ASSLQPRYLDVQEPVESVVADGMTVAVVWGSEPPAFSIGWTTPFGPGDSGFTVLFEDAPNPGGVHGPTCHPGIELVCLHCLLDDTLRSAVGSTSRGSTAWRISATTASGPWATSADLNPTDAPGARWLRLPPAIGSAGRTGWGPLGGRAARVFG